MKAILRVALYPTQSPQKTTTTLAGIPEEVIIDLWNIILYLVIIWN